MTKTAPTPIDPLVLAPSQRPSRPGTAEKATMFDALLAARRQQDVGQSVAEPPPRAPAPPERNRAPAQSLAKATADRQPDTRPDLRRSASRADAQAQGAADAATPAPEARAPDAVLMADTAGDADLAASADVAAEVVDDDTSDAPVAEAAPVLPQDAPPPPPTKTAEAAAALAEAPKVDGGQVDANQLALGATAPVIAPAAAAPVAAPTPVAPTAAAPIAPVAPAAAPAPGPAPTPAPAATPVVDPATVPVAASATTVAQAVSAPTVATTVRAATTAVATPVTADGEQAAAPAVPAPVQPLATTQPATALTPAMVQMADDLAQLAPNTPVSVQVAAAAAPKPVAPAPVAIDGKSIVAIADAARSGRATGTTIERPVEAIVRGQPLPGETLLAPSTLGDLPPQGPPKLSGSSAFQTMLASAPDAADTALPSPVASAAQPTNAPQATNAANHAAPTRPHRPIPVVDQVATGVFRAATEGGGKVTIGLTPQNLGRVEVEIEVKDGSKVTAVVVAERQETLDLLRRDAHTLERALADAGLKTDSNSLQFHLRGQARDEGDSPRQRSSRGGGLAGDIAADDQAPGRQQRYGGALGGVDVTI